jgi:hypothetical protein
MEIYEVLESTIAVEPEELNVVVPYIALVKETSQYVYPYSPSEIIVYHVIPDVKNYES